MYNHYMSYYNAYGEPLGMWDGVDRYEGAMGTDVDATYKYYFNGYIGRAPKSSPVAMDIAATRTADDVGGEITVGVTPESSMPGSYEMTVVIYQNLWPDSDPDIPHLGLSRVYNESIDLAKRGRIEVTVPYMNEFWWDTTQLGVAAFVRDLSTKEIQQGIATEEFTEPQEPARSHQRPFSK